MQQQGVTSTHCTRKINAIALNLGPIAEQEFIFFPSEFVTVMCVQALRLEIDVLLLLK